MSHKSCWNICNFWLSQWAWFQLGAWWKHFVILMQKVLCSCISYVCHLVPGKAGPCKWHFRYQLRNPLQHSLPGEQQCNCEICLADTASHSCCAFPPPTCPRTPSLPHRAAHRTSELNFFLYLRISGLSLCGRILVGLTLTTEPFLAFSLLTGSGLALDAGMKDTHNCGNCECLVTAHIWITLFMVEQKKPQRGETTPRELCIAKKNKIWKIPQALLRKHGGNTAAEHKQTTSERRAEVVKWKFTVMWDYYASFRRFYSEFHFQAVSPLYT